MPIAVEALGGATIGIDQHSGSRLRLTYPTVPHQKYEDASNETTVHDSSLIEGKKKAVNGLHPPTARGGIQ
jgi:hypothetical protein